MVASGEDAEGSEAARALRRHVSGREDLELLPLSRLAALAAEDESAEDASEAAVVEARHRIGQAEDAFSRFDYAGATTQLGEALELLRPTATRPSGRERLADVHLQLAMVLLVHGEREAAVEELRTCRHIHAACAPDAARHPPELVALAAEPVAAEEQASLRVDTDPPGARVSLDGGEPRATPHAFTELSAGRHYVALERDGFLPEVHLVSVAAGTPTERRFSLTAGPPPTRASAALRDLSQRGVEADPRWRAEAATLSEADFLAVLSRQGAQLALGLFDARGAVLDEVARGAEAELNLQEILDARLPPPTVPFYGQWWFWTPIAAAIAIGLAAATFAVVNVPSVRLVGGTVSRE